MKVVRKIIYTIPIEHVWIEVKNSIAIDVRKSIHWSVFQEVLCYTREIGGVTIWRLLGTQPRGTQPR